MTEIPAKTPRPIGRTDSFLPGIVDSTAAAAATPDTPTADGSTDIEEVPRIVEVSVSPGNGGLTASDGEIIEEEGDGISELELIAGGLALVVGELEVVVRELALVIEELALVGGELALAGGNVTVSVVVVVEGRVFELVVVDVILVLDASGDEGSSCTTHESTSTMTSFPPSCAGVKVLTQVADGKTTVVTETRVAGRGALSA